MTTKRWGMFIGLLFTLLTIASGPSSVTAASGWRQLTVGGNPSAVCCHMLAYDSKRDMVVRFGGSTGGHNIDETWELDMRQRAWIQRTPSHSPPARYFGGMAYDQARGVTVLFGGRDVNYEFLNDTWLWDGQDWSQVFPADSPDPRYGHGQVYDSRRGVVVLYGGSGFRYHTDLWQWDGTNWSKRPAAPLPPARYGMAFAYDSRRDVLVVFGGIGGNGLDFLDDTWEWANGTWTQRQPATIPPGRVFMASAYSPVAGYTLIFGGEGADYRIRDDTWLWNGIDWTQVSQDPHPSARTGLPAVYSPSLRGIVIYGGLNSSFNQLDDTWVFADVR